MHYVCISYLQKLREHQHNTVRVLDLYFYLCFYIQNVHRDVPNQKKRHVKSCISIRVFTFYTHVCMYFVSSRNTCAPAQHGAFLYFLT